MAKNNDDSVIKNAQYRKGLSIAFFNATNAAIELCKGMNVHEESTIKKVVELRDFFLSEHKNYWATVIEKVGNNYDVAETIKRLKAVKNITELKTVWIALSEDERRDEKVIEVVKQLKKEHETIQ